MRSLPALTAALFCLALTACPASERDFIRAVGPEVHTGNLTMTPVRVTTREGLRRSTDAQLGVLTVPERHASPSGRTVQIRFLRFPSTSPHPGPPIVYLAGGPGGSGTLSATGDRFPLFMKLRAAGDVIALDQRGVFGTPQYRVCPGAWDYALDRPLSEQNIREAVVPWVTNCAAAFADSFDIAAFNTRESADDLDALRAALGAEQLHLWGISYGTHLGLAYIRRYPERVAGAVLAGVEGPDHSYKLPANLDRSIVVLDSLIRADPRAHALVPDLLGSMEVLVDSLERTPLLIEVERDGERRRVVLDANDLRSAIYGEMGEREDIIALLPRITAVLDGDFTVLAQRSLGVRTGRRSSVMHLAMDCASGASDGRRRTIREQAQSALMGEVGSMELRVLCERFPHEDLGDEFRSPVQSSARVLFISGSLDPRTPASNAEEVLAGFPNGRHLVIEGGSHDDDLFLADGRIGDEILNFLQGGEPGTDRIVLPPLRFDTP